MRYKEEPFCQDCGELESSCICGSCQESDDVNDDKEWRFEYAFESITEERSSFKHNMPIK